LLKTDTLESDFRIAGRKERSVEPRPAPLVLVRGGSAGVTRATAALRVRAQRISAMTPISP
jgi:hypothetical protein